MDILCMWRGACNVKNMKQHTNTMHGPNAEVMYRDMALVESMRV